MIVYLATFALPLWGLLPGRACLAGEPGRLV